MKGKEEKGRRRKEVRDGERKERKKGKETRTPTDFCILSLVPTTPQLRFPALILPRGQGQNQHLGNSGNK